jgi:hypothetical protein
LTDSGTAVVQRFTFGEGTTGLPREAYYAGWEVVGIMMERLGMSLHDVAIVPPTEYPVLIQRAIDIATKPSRD